MTIAGRDSSAFLPDDAGLRQAYADGIRFWAGYFAGPGIWVGWPDSNFLRIKAAGMQSLAFCSGGSDPLACRARADRLGILFGTDTEANIPDGGQAWLDASVTGGAYGGYAVMSRRAAWHIVADYRAIPGDTWPSYLARPAGPLGWQCQGTHSEYGGSVDSSRLDDSFGGVPAPTPQPQGDQDVPIFATTTDPNSPNHGKVFLVANPPYGPKRYVPDAATEGAYASVMTDATIHTYPGYVIDAMETEDPGEDYGDALAALKAQVATITAGTQGPTGPAGPPGPAVTSVTISGTYPVK